MNASSDLTIRTRAGARVTWSLFPWKAESEGRTEPARRRTVNIQICRDARRVCGDARAPPALFCQNRRRKVSAGCVGKHIVMLVCPRASRAAPIATDLPILAGWRAPRARVA